jgi:hypothetical protein
MAKKYPTIKPKFVTDKQGKPVSVYLDLEVFESIFQEIEDLERKIEQTKHKEKTSNKRK